MRHKLQGLKVNDNEVSLPWFDITAMKNGTVNVTPDLAEVLARLDQAENVVIELVLKRQENAAS